MFRPPSDALSDEYLLQDLEVLGSIPGLDIHAPKALKVLVASHLALGGARTGSITLCRSVLQ